MNQRELQAYLKELLGEDWETVWRAFEGHRQLCLWRLRDAAGELNCEPGISQVRFRLEIEYICRLIAEHGP